MNSTSQPRESLNKMLSVQQTTRSHGLSTMHFIPLIPSVQLAGTLCFSLFICLFILVPTAVPSERYPVAVGVVLRYPVVVGA